MSRAALKLGPYIIYGTGAVPTGNLMICGWSSKRQKRKKYGRKLQNILKTIAIFPDLCYSKVK
jgi:hypothetical protein